LVWQRKRAGLCWLDAGDPARHRELVKLDWPRPGADWNLAPVGERIYFAAFEDILQSSHVCGDAKNQDKINRPIYKSLVG